MVRMLVDFTLTVLGFSIILVSVMLLMSAFS